MVQFPIHLFFYDFQFRDISSKPADIVALSTTGTYQAKSCLSFGYLLEMNMKTTLVSAIRTDPE